MSLQLTPGNNSYGDASQSRALVLARPTEETLIIDELGNEIITIYVGPTKQPFSVHKKLLTVTGPFFVDLFNISMIQGQPTALVEESPAPFKLLLEFLYTKRVPGVLSAGADRKFQVARLRQLCQLYTFVDRYKLNNTVRNKVMDSVQDGFATLKVLPAAGLVTAIYKNTTVGSKIRDFCTHSLLYDLRTSGPGANIAALSGLIKTNDDVRGDILTAIASYHLDNCDPRIRDCKGDPACTECLTYPDRLAVSLPNGTAGTWPCAFHVHKMVEADGTEAFDTGCYLWVPQA